VLKSAVAKAKLGNDEELAALRRLDDQARILEGAADGPEVEDLIDAERRASHAYGGRSVFGVEQAPGNSGAIRSAEDPTLSLPVNR
jgi:hypothetical protein